MANLRRTKLKGWYEYYRETCPICHKSGGCMINEKGDTVVCIRVESKTLFSKRFVSWIHYLKEDKRRNVTISDGQEFIEGLPKASSDKLNSIYTALLDSTHLTDVHYEHLTSRTRQMNDREISIRGYRSFPSKPWDTVKDMAHNYYLNQEDFKGVPGFYENQYGWSIAGREGILIPYRNHVNQIIGFQIRIDNPPPELEINIGSITGLQARIKDYPLVQIMIDGEIIEEVELPLGKTHSVYYENGYGFVKTVKGKRYFWISSANKKNGTAPGSPLPVHVAVPTEELQTWKTGETRKTSSVWITEGPLKADIAAQHINKVYDAEELIDIGNTVLAVAGVNTWRTAMPILEAMGVRHVNIAFDMDGMDNPTVAMYIKQLILELKDKGYSANLVLWNPDDGKGIDDVLINRRYPTLKKLY